MSTMRCLGKLPAVHDPRTLKVSSIMGLPPPKAAWDWLSGMPEDLGMMRNDQIGDCAYAGPAHLVQAWTHNSLHQTTTISDADVVAAYSRDTGYTPSDPSTDRGAVLLNMLNAWRTKGIGGHKIGAFAQVDHHNWAEVCSAIDLFGGLITGAMLPASAQNGVGSVWNQVSSLDLGSWGGHCMMTGTHRGGSVHGPGPTFVTWGKRQDATLPWWDTYVDECYVIISADWVTGARPAPSGFNLPTLQTYLAQIH
jgi:hypothetical protein